MPVQDLSLSTNALIFAVAAAVVWVAGTRLAVFADGIAAKTNMGQVFVGMLLLGGITSSPEMANVVTSSSMNNPRLAINNLLGSAAINVFLLALVDAWIGRDAVTSQVAKPSTLMMATLCMVVLVIIAIAVAVGDQPFVLGVGIGSLCITAMSIGFFWMAAGYDDRAQWVIREPHQIPPGDRHPVIAASLRSLLIRTAIAGVLLLDAGYTLSVTGDAIAAQTGLGSGIVGFALIGIVTSAPELSTIVQALKLRQYEMAFGQVLGTNFINLSLFLLADVTFTAGPVINELGPFEIVSALIGATLIGVFLVGLLEHRNRTIGRMGYDSFAVISLFCCGLALLYLSD